MDNLHDSNEPVAHVVIVGDMVSVSTGSNGLKELHKLGDGAPLYTTPPQRTWVGLTPEEVDSLANLKVDGAYLSVPDTIRQTDAKLKEKNT